MKLILYVFIACCAITAAKSAENQITVKASEHEGFSRIVLNNAPQDTKIQRDSAVIRITFPGDNTLVNASDILQTQKNARISAGRFVTSRQSSSLHLTLSCYCNVHEFFDLEAGLIIEIEDVLPSNTTRQLESSQTKPVAAKQSSFDSKSEIDSIRKGIVELLAAAEQRGFVDYNFEKTPQKHDVRNKSTEKAIINPARELIEAPAPVCDISHHWAEILADIPPKKTTEIAAMAKSVNSQQNSNKIDIDRVVATEYLRLGFFEEARAIARAHGQTAEMALIASLAELPLNTMTKTVAYFEEREPCGAIFEVLSSAARVKNRESNHFEFEERHYRALGALVASLRVPISELLALHALDNDEILSAEQFLEIGKMAGPNENSPVNDIIQAAISPSIGDDESLQQLQEIAQAPNRLQAKALGEIARRVEADRGQAYDGYLEDLIDYAAAPPQRAKQNNAQAFSSANVLASAGKLSAAVSILAHKAGNSPGSLQSVRNHARELILSNITANNPDFPFAALNAYFNHQDFLSNASDPRLEISVAQELAAIGAPNLSKSVLSKTNGIERDEADEIMMRAFLSAEDYDRVLDIANSNPSNIEGAALAVRASGHMNDASVFQTPALRNASNYDVATAAWRAGHAEITAELLSETPFSALSPEHQEMRVLAELRRKTDLSQMNVAVSNDEHTNTLLQMLKAAPTGKSSVLKDIFSFQQNLDREIQFIRKRLKDE